MTTPKPTSTTDPETMPRIKAGTGALQVAVVANEGPSYWDALVKVYGDPLRPMEEVPA